MIPSVNRILETGLYVGDVARSMGFYQRLFGFEKIVSDERFCALAVADAQVLLLFLRGGTLLPLVVEGGVIPPHDGAGEMHFAFGIDASELDPWTARLAEFGIPIESRVTWPRGGVSLYFRDPDAHLVELVTPGIWPIY
jgi:catechol 2,3-dioxygenase-like lactoylglutathione lyase family enzyme